MLTIEGDSRGIDANRVKSRLALATLAYKSKADLEFDPEADAIGRPEGWKAEPELSTYGWKNGWTGERYDKSVQMVAFANHDEKRLVFAFKGSNNLENFESDLRDSGYSAWSSIAPEVERAVELAEKKFPGYIIESAGHSLGGGLAQTAAIKYGWSGYTLNSLPVSKGFIKSEYGTKELFDAAANEWKKKHRMVAVRVKHDLATLFYKIFKREYYLDTTSLTFDFPEETRKRPQRRTDSNREKTYTHMGVLFPVTRLREILKNGGDLAHQISPLHIVKRTFIAHSGKTAERAMEGWDTQTTEAVRVAVKEFDRAHTFSRENSLASGQEAPEQYPKKTKKPVNTVGRSCSIS